MAAENIPEDMRQALEAAQLLEKYESLALSHRREYEKWINEAKKADTRSRRIQKMCEMLRAK